MNIIQYYSHVCVKNRTNLRAAKARIKILLIVCPIPERNGSGFRPENTASNMPCFQFPIWPWRIGTFLPLNMGSESSIF